MTKTFPKPAAKKAPAEAEHVMVSARLHTAKLAALDALSSESGINRSALIQLAIERLLKQGL